MLKKLSLFIFVIFLTHSFSRADTLEKIKNNGELKVCTTAGYAPFEVKTSKGKWVGFDVEMFHAFAKKIQVKLNLLDIRWEGVFPALLSKKCDMITGGISVTEERKKTISFSDVIYKSGNSLVVSIRDKSKYKNLVDLDQKGVLIAVKTGNTADLVLQKKLEKAKLLKFDSNADMLTAVLEKRATAFAQDTVYAYMASNEHKGKLIILPDKINYEDLAVGLRKDDSNLLKEFNSFLADWKKEGGYDKAVKYYIESDKWMVELKK